MSTANPRRGRAMAVPALALRRIDTDPATEPAANEAWGYVLGGMRKALAVPDLPRADRDSLLLCYDLVAACAGQQPRQPGEFVKGRA